MERLPSGKLGVCASLHLVEMHGVNYYMLRLGAPKPPCTNAYPNATRLDGAASSEVAS